MARIFYDSNIIIYAFANDAKAPVAGDLLLQGGEISVQVLNEFTHVARRKLGFDWDMIDNAIADICVLARAVHPILLDTHIQARSIAQRHKLSYYDSVIIASALHARCDMLYSEDMQDGMVIDDRLLIRNPFVA